MTKRRRQTNQKPLSNPLKSEAKFLAKMLVNVVPYYLLLLLPLCTPISYYLTGDTWMMMFIAFGIIPLTDYIFNVDYENPTKQEQKQMHHAFKYRLPVQLAVLVEMAFWVWCLHVAVYHDLTKFQLVGLLSSMGIIGGVGINISHELLHKTENKFEVFLGHAILGHLNYMHFYLEHIWGHHKNVATFNDPATSRLNETLYTFLPRTIIGSFISSWKIEKERLKSMGVNTAWSLHNIHFSYFLTYAIIWTLVYKVFGAYGLCFHLIAGVTGFSYLEVVNYVEHYGLLRKELSPGKFEPVDIRHSWNAPQLISNYLLLKLQRHSDHHENAKKPYQNLCSYKESPTLPTGYPLSILMALIPPVWFTVMNAVLKQYHEEGKHVPLKCKTSQRILHATLVFYFCFFLGMVLACSGGFECIGEQLRPSIAGIASEYGIDLQAQVHPLFLH